MVGTSYLCATNPIFELNVLESSGICKPGENSTVHLTGQGISFASPNFPVYPGNGSCHWNISVPPGNFIRLTFWYVYGSCNSSYVEVYDVTNFTWINMRRFCSLFKPQVVYSKGSSFLVTYVIASESLLNGFFATYETLTVVPAPYACSKSSLRPYDRITLHDTSGELASYQYPLPYSNDVNCFWTIEVPVGYNINFTFHSFDLQQSEDCLADYVLIKQEKYSWQTGDILTHSRRFCGSSLPAAIQSNHKKMNVDFVADSSGRYPGFHASYTAIEDRKSALIANEVCMNHVICLLCKEIKLVVPLSRSPSSETRKKPARDKRGRVRSWGREARASRHQDLARSFFFSRVSFAFRKTD